MSLRSKIVAALVLLIVTVLGGCAHHAPASVTGGECKAFDRPTYAVRGVRQYDQDWIDSTIEGGVGACNWQRPTPRPVEMDATPAPVKAKPVAKPKKPGWLRFLHGLRRKAATETAAKPVEPEPAPSPVPYILPTPSPTPAKRRPIDVLLGGGK